MLFIIKDLKVVLSCICDNTVIIGFDALGSQFIKTFLHNLTPFKDLGMLKYLLGIDIISKKEILYVFD